MIIHVINACNMFKSKLIIVNSRILEESDSIPQNSCSFSQFEEELDRTKSLVPPEGQDWKV